MLSSCSLGSAGDLVSGVFLAAGEERIEQVVL